MGEDQTLYDYPGFFYHRITDPEVLQTMETVRQQFLEIAKHVLEYCPYNRERSLALTHLQIALTMAIASNAVVHGEKQVPIGFYHTWEEVPKPEKAP